MTAHRPWSRQCALPGAIEPVLKRAIDAESTVDARSGVAFEELVQGPDAVIATVKHVETGRTEKD
jgi:hypothetical protein